MCNRSIYIIGVNNKYNQIRGIAQKSQQKQVKDQTTKAQWKQRAIRNNRKSHSNEKVAYHERAIDLKEKATKGRKI